MKHLADRPVFSKIVYSQCWEDPAIAAEALRLGPGDDLFCLTSAGDNVMALALRRPRSIVALDFSAAQNALLELKLAALRKLGWHDYVAFLGARPAFDRLATYQRLRRELTDDARAHLDAQPGAIAGGIIHAGRFQRYLARFRTSILPLIHGRAVVEEIMTIDDRDARAAYYDRIWDNRRWRALFTVFFGRAVMARLGRDPAFFRYVDQTQIGATFLARARRALVETSPRDNHFLQYALLGRYPDLERAPIYLRESSFDALRAACEAIRIVRGEAAGYLEAQPDGALSALYLSDLFEWVSPEAHASMLRTIARVGRPGGRIVYWNLLVPRRRPDALADRIAVHDDEARALHRRDLAFVYGSLHVESVR
jgi:S-adenosylmethionine-diacylglycerol 3-amino-3-carboxypropyl transferase